MADVETLLPQSSTPMERTLEQSTAPEPRLGAGADAITGVKGDTLPTWLPFLLWEHGLSALTPFVPNAYTLLQDGRLWHLERGTFAPVSRGLGWVGRAATIREAPTRRRWWNSFQLSLDAIPATDADLDSIDRITTLSVMERSDFRRAWHGYDGPALEADYSRLDQSILDDESGVAIREGGPKWSFGRQYVYQPVLTQAEGDALGIWIEPTAEPSITWEDATVAWEDAGFAWESDAATQRAASLAAAILPLGFLVALLDADGTPIGYRRPRAAVGVAPDAAGPYVVNGFPYAPSGSPTAVYVDAWTGFGDGSGAQVATVALLVDSTRAAGVPPGRLWLGPEDVEGGILVGSQLLPLTLRETVRERFTFLLRF